MQCHLTITLKVKVAWWVPVYVNTVAFIFRLTNQLPDEDKMAYWIQRGITIELEDPVPENVKTFARKLQKIESKNSTDRTPS